MANTRDIRRLAFQMLYQLDARPDDEPGLVLERATDDDEDQRAEFTPADRRKAAQLASAAYDDRASADAFTEQTAPGWPSHRQAAVDRAILRLAHYEMTREQVPPKVVVNEAVELAKAYSTDKSPSFVNGILDKLLKQVLKLSAPASPEEPSVPTESSAAVGPADSAHER